MAWASLREAGRGLPARMGSAKTISSFDHGKRARAGGFARGNMDAAGR